MKNKQKSSLGCYFILRGHNKPLRRESTVNTFQSFEHNGVTYLTKNRIISIENEIVTFEIVSKKHGTYLSKLDLMNIDLLRFKVGLSFRGRAAPYAHIVLQDSRVEMLHNVVGRRMGLIPQGRTLTIDHSLSGGKLNNCTSNLSLADHSQQQLNKSKVRSHRGRPCTSNYFGVSVTGDYYGVCVYHPDTSKNIRGRFADERTAALYVTQEMKSIDPIRWATKITYNEGLLNQH